MSMVFFTSSTTKSWSESLTLATSNAGGAGAMIDNAVNALQASLGLAMSRSKGDTSSTTYNNSTLTAESGSIKINSLNDGTISGANLLAENIELNTQGDLTVESLQNSYKDKSSSFGINLGGGSGVSGGGNGSFGINYSSNKTDRLWVDNQTSILGTNSVTINTGNNTDIKGALIANATNADSVILSGSEGSRELIDGGGLSINTNSLTFSDISDHEYSQSTGFGISTNIGKGANNNIAGQGTAPSSNPNQQNNYYPNGSTTISANNSGYKKEQTTYATIGDGDITTNSNVTFDANGNVITTTGGTLLASTDALLAGLNRDVANSQVMTKDTITNALDVDVSIDNRLIAAAFGSDSAAVSLRSDQENLAGNLIVSNTTLITGTKDIITSAFETNPHDPKNDTYFEVLSNKTALRTNSILNTESLLQSAENAKYYNNPSDNKAGFYDPETGETYINLAYNQSTVSLMETTLHEGYHKDNKLSQSIEESLAQNYSQQATDLINFYHNRGEYSDNLSSQLVSWAYQNSGLSSQYNSSENYLNNFYGISTANVTPASIAVNNFIASGVRDDEVEMWVRQISGTNQYEYKQQIPGRPGVYRTGITTKEEGRYIDPAPKGLDAEQQISFVNDDPKNPTPDQKVSFKLAETIEQVIGASDYFVNINSTTGGHKRGAHVEGRAADINLINGVAVKDRSPSNLSNIRDLGILFYDKASVNQVLSPVVNADKPARTKPYPEWLLKKHDNHIHVNVSK